MDFEVEAPASLAHPTVAALNATQFYDPEFASDGFRADVAFEDKSPSALLGDDFLNTTYFFGDEPSTSFNQIASIFNPSSSETLKHNFVSDDFNPTPAASNKTSRAASPVPDDLDMDFPSVPLSDGSDLEDDVSTELIFSRSDKKSPLLAAVLSKKVNAPNTKVTAIKKERAAKAKAAHAVAAALKEEHVPVVPVLPPCKKAPASPAAASASSSVLTEEERKERNKIAAQKYRSKLREQANETQVRCAELQEEQRALRLQIAQEREKIKEIRELLVKHGLLS